MKPDSRGLLWARVTLEIQKGKKTDITHLESYKKEIMKPDSKGLLWARVSWGEKKLKLVV